jgi:hypothetical protein
MPGVRIAEILGTGVNGLVALHFVKGRRGAGTIVELRCQLCGDANAATADPGHVFRANFLEMIVRETS